MWAWSCRTPQHAFVGGGEDSVPAKGEAAGIQGRPGPAELSESIRQSPRGLSQAPTESSEPEEDSEALPAASVGARQGGGCGGKEGMC